MSQAIPANNGRQVWPQQEPGGAWHCEIVSRYGETLHVMPSADSREKAIAQALTWCGLVATPASVAINFPTAW